MAWTSNDGRKDGTWRVITGKPGLAHAGAIVADQSGNFVVAHFHWILSMVNWTVLTRRLMPLVNVLVAQQPTYISLYTSREPGGGRWRHAAPAGYTAIHTHRSSVRSGAACHRQPYMANRRPNWVGKP